MKKNILFLTIFTVFSSFLFAFDRPIVKNISAIPGKINTITISWTLPESPKPEISTLKVYRTLKQIENFSELKDETPIATLESDSTGYTDQVPNYKDYFYTILAKCESKIQTEIIPSQNATVNGVHLSIPEVKSEKKQNLEKQQKAYPEGTLREKPLPYLDLIKKQNEKKVEMNLQAKSVAKNLGLENKTKIEKIKKPYVFEEDLISPEVGDDVLLFEILKDYFIQKKYTECQAQLSKLLRTNISESVLNRSTFYLGESYYFQENYEAAVKSFLKVYEIYPELSKKWISSSLDLLEIPEY